MRRWIERPEGMLHGKEGQLYAIKRRVLHTLSTVGQEPCYYYGGGGCNHCIASSNLWCKTVTNSACLALPRLRNHTMARGRCSAATQEAIQCSSCKTLVISKGSIQ